MKLLNGNNKMTKNKIEINETENKKTDLGVAEKHLYILCLYFNKTKQNHRAQKEKKKTA